MSWDADVCVVGAGAGGAVAAWALVRRGVRVLLLDTGPRFAPSDFRTHAQDFELLPAPLEAVAAEPARRSYESDAGQLLEPGYTHLASVSPTAAARPVAERRLPFHCSRALGVGGTTLHYHGEAHRFPAHAFRMRSERGVAEDWPIDHRELEPFYARVERLLGVAGEADNPFKPPRGPYPYPAHPLSLLSRRVAVGAQQLGLRVLPNPLAILPRARPRRSPCHYCNRCTRGCAIGAKGSVDVAVLPEAEASGRLRIAAEHHVTHLESGDDGRIIAALVRDASGRERRLRARAFVLAAGAIETPRILLNSIGPAHPIGIGNAEDQVGRHLMELLYVIRGGILEENLTTYAGVPLDSRIWDGNGARVSSELPNGYVLGQGCGILLGPAAYAREAVEGFGIAHREALRRRFGAGVEFLGVAEQLPRLENRVALSEGRDAYGFPLARVTAELDRTDLDALSIVWTRLGELAEVSGLAEPTHQFTAYDVPNATHVGGTCRMGTDPRRSVVDAWSRVHRVSNLVIADASVLVTQGAGDSPSLTIQALALRAAEALADRARRGEL